MAAWICKVKSFENMRGNNLANGGNYPIHSMSIDSINSMCSIVFLSILPEDAWNPAESAAVEASMSFRTGMLPPNLGGS